MENEEVVGYYNGFTIRKCGFGRCEYCRTLFNELYIVNCETYIDETCVEVICIPCIEKYIDSNSIHNLDEH